MTKQATRGEAIFVSLLNSIPKKDTQEFLQAVCVIDSCLQKERSRNAYKIRRNLRKRRISSCDRMERELKELRTENEKLKQIQARNESEKQIIQEELDQKKVELARINDELKQEKVGREMDITTSEALTVRMAKELTRLQEVLSEVQEREKEIVPMVAQMQNEIKGLKDVTKTLHTNTPPPGAKTKKRIARKKKNSSNPPSESRPG